MLFVRANLRATFHYYGSISFCVGKSVKFAGHIDDGTLGPDKETRRLYRHSGMSPLVIPACR